jgi:hypothetical protein
LVFAFALTGCDYEEVEREIGYKGQARIDPWLAAGRFLERYGYHVRKQPSWAEPKPDDAVWFVPAEAIGNEVFARTAANWVSQGGHLVLLVERALATYDDWGYDHEAKLEKPLLDMLGNTGLTLEEAEQAGIKRDKLVVDSRAFEAETASRWQVKRAGDEAGTFASIEYGEGRISVLTDASPIRNRKIDAKQHAAFLLELVEASPYSGDVVFLRGHTLSLWKLLVEKASPALLGLALVIVFWLWRNFARFGPLEAAEEPSPLRGYDHHLEALGDFHWRLDRGAALLAPLRTEILERCHQLQARTGRLDDDIFALLAERAGVSRERIVRALSEPAPADAAVFTRTVSDLQRILATFS